LNFIFFKFRLGLPFAFKQSGLIIGLLLVICCALFSLYTMVLLSLSADKTGVYNFERLGYLTYGRLGAAFSQLSLFGCLFGTLCAYFVIIADFVTPLVNTWAGVDISRFFSQFYENSE
jgi:solute carrier family 38 (sodium-coupled neutral amino acid transporter), member 11